MESGRTIYELLEGGRYVYCCSESFPEGVLYHSDLSVVVGDCDCTQLPVTFDKFLSHINAVIEWKVDFDVLTLDEDAVTHFHDIFLKIVKRDKCKNDTPRISTAVTYLGCGGSKFMRRVFNMLDQDQKSEQIDFHEFVIIVWNYCTLEEHFGSFVFEVYDFDGNGKLDHSEYDEMMEELYGTKNPSHNAFQELKASILRQKQLGNTGVSRHFFKEYCKLHKEVLAPVIGFQKKLRRMFMRGALCDRAIVRRNEISGQRYVSVVELEKQLLDNDLVWTLGPLDGKGPPAAQEQMSLDGLLKAHRRPSNASGRRMSINSNGSDQRETPRKSNGSGRERGRRLSRQHSATSFNSQGSSNEGTPDGRRRSFAAPIGSPSPAGRSSRAGAGRRTFPADDREPTFPHMQAIGKNSKPSGDVPEISEPTLTARNLARVAVEKPTAAGVVVEGR